MTRTPTTPEAPAPDAQTATAFLLAWAPEQPWWPLVEHARSAGFSLRVIVPGGPPIPAIAPERLATGTYVAAARFRGSRRGFTVEMGEVGDWLALVYPDNLVIGTMPRVSADDYQHFHPGAPLGWNPATTGDA